MAPLITQGAIKASTLNPAIRVWFPNYQRAIHCQAFAAWGPATEPSDVDEVHKVL